MSGKGVNEEDQNVGIPPVFFLEKVVPEVWSVGVVVI